MPPTRTSSVPDLGAEIASPGSWEPILRGARRDVDIVVARDGLTITHARYEAGELVADPHVHHEHTDAFYVLDGELAFEIGRETKTLVVSAGGFVAVPPGVAHSFRTGGDRPARWLTLHAPDGGFAAFMRGVRDGVETEWDIFPVPSHGGLPAGEAIVSTRAPWESGARTPVQVAVPPRAEGEVTRLPKRASVA